MVATSRTTEHLPRSRLGLGLGLGLGLLLGNGFAFSLCLVLLHGGRLCAVFLLLFLLFHLDFIVVVLGLIWPLVLLKNLGADLAKVFL